MRPDDVDNFGAEYGVRERDRLWRLSPGVTVALALVVALYLGFVLGRL